MVANLKYGTLFFWGAANLCIAVISYFLIRETQGLSLEEINAVCDDFLLFVFVVREAEVGGKREWKGEERVTREKCRTTMMKFEADVALCSNSMALRRFWRRRWAVRRERRGGKVLRMRSRTEKVEEELHLHHFDFYRTFFSC